MSENPTMETLIQTLLDQPVLARIATANPKTDQPHVTPVWFLWDGEILWMSGFVSTRKFKNLLRNPRCSVLIEPKESDGQPQAVLFEGAAEVLAEPRELVEEMSLRIYERYLGVEGAQAAEPQSWVHDTENRIIRLKPKHRYIW